MNPPEDNHGFNFPRHHEHCLRMAAEPAKYTTRFGSVETFKTEDIPLAGSGGRTRTCDTRIMIPLLMRPLIRR